MPGNQRAAEGLIALRITAERDRAALEADRFADGFADDSAALGEEAGGFYFEGAEIDFVFGTDGDARRDAIVESVERGAVGGMQIFDGVVAGAFDDASVFAGDHAVIEDDVAFLRAAYADHAGAGGSVYRGMLRWMRGRWRRPGECD